MDEQLITKLLIAAIFFAAGITAARLVFSIKANETIKRYMRRFNKK